MEALKGLLSSHIPYDEYEKADIENFIYALETLGDKIFYRDCLIGNIATIVWVVNPSRTKVLLGYHNLLQTFNWFGGHTDGELNTLRNSQSEFREETSIKNYKVLNGGKPIAFSALTSQKHMRKGKVVSNHVHYCPVYAFEVEEDEPFNPNKKEISKMQWFMLGNVINKIIGDKDATILAERLIAITKNLP